VSSLDLTFDGRFLPVGDERLFMISVQSQAHAQDGPAAVIVPPYGKTSLEMFFTAACLAFNGFVVHRFDARHHVGLSSGEIIDYRMSEVQKDLERVLEEVSGPALLVGTSLSAPIVFKVGASRRDLAGAVVMVPVVDGGDTIARVTGHEVTPYRERQPGLPELQEIFGHAVRAQAFIDDMDRAGFGRFDGINRLVAENSRPVHVLAAARDEYVSAADTERLRASLPEGSEFVVLEKASHELTRSVSAMRELIGEVTFLSCRVFKPDIDREGVRLPPITDVIRQNSREQSYLDQIAGD
jgi:pimeloyl-ACP methyl ester carboxylesterase